MSEIKDVVIERETEVSLTNSETEENSEYSAELEKIFTQLQEKDELINKTRQNTARLGIETRSMLDDLRKQLG